MTDQLLVAGRTNRLPRESIQRAKRERKLGRCEFCETEVVYRRANYNDLKQKGYDVHICCLTCYSDGTYLRQGYRR